MIGRTLLNRLTNADLLEQKTRIIQTLEKTIAAQSEQLKAAETFIEESSRKLAELEKRFEELTFGLTQIRAYMPEQQVAESGVKLGEDKVES